MWYGLIAALGYGTADVVATASARRSGVMPTLLAIQVAGSVAVGVALMLDGTSPTGPAWAWLLAVALASLNFAGMLLLYRAFAIGTLSLVSPIASGFAVVTAGLAFLSGERPPQLALVGTAALITGVALVSGVTSTAGATRAGVPEAIGAALSLGAFYWGLGVIIPEMGVLWPVLVSRVVQAFIALGVLWARPTMPGVPARPSLQLCVVAGILDTVALVAFNVGVESAFTTTTTAITSLYSVVTVFLAWVLFRERLAPGQWGGVVAVIAGIFIVSISAS